MTWAVEFDDRVAKDLRKLDKQAQRDIFCILSPLKNYANCVTQLDNLFDQRQVQQKFVPRLLDPFRLKESGIAYRALSLH